jgi:hypothetical protein
VLFAPWLVVLMAGAAGIVEMSIGLHAARIKKPFLLPAHHLYWTRAAMLAVIIFGLPRFTYLFSNRALAVNSNAFDAALLLPIGLAAGCFWMLGRGYAAPGLERNALLDTVREVLREMGYNARESTPRPGEDEFMLLGAGTAIIVQAPWWSGTPRLRVQPAGSTPILRQIGSAVNVLLVLGSHDVRSAPFVLHTLKGALLIVAAITGLLLLMVGGR